MTCLRDHMKYKEPEILDTHPSSKSAFSKNHPGIGLQLRVEKHQARQNIRKPVYSSMASPALDLLRAQNSPWMGLKIEKTQCFLNIVFIQMAASHLDAHKSALQLRVANVKDENVHWHRIYSAPQCVHRELFFFKNLRFFQLFAPPRT